jgi:tetratricopeptide (TPR) repeat protein
MSFSQGELARARSALTLALAIARDAGEMDVMAQSENLLGYVEYGSGNRDAARERFTRSVAQFRELPSPWGLGLALNGLARVALVSGDFDAAERLLDEAVPCLQSAGPWFVSLTLSVRANLEVRRGNADAAIASLRECLTHIRDLHDKYTVGYALVSLAGAAILKGDYTWAARILGIREALSDRAGAPVLDRTVQEIMSRAERDVREHLGPARFGLAYAIGKSASIDMLLKDIDSAAV